MSKPKKEWTKPQLIVLTRGTPEEAVLTVCKQIGATHGADNANQEGCNDQIHGECGACQSRSGIS